VDFEPGQGVREDVTVCERALHAWICSRVDQAALDVHAKLNSTRPPLRPELRLGQGEREDYEYRRTR